jgi:SAM-dependent methyltransferase
MVTLSILDPHLKKGQLWYDENNFMDKKTRTTFTYNHSAKDFAKMFDTGKPRSRDINNAFELRGKKNPLVLEVGSGSGRDAKEILKQTNRYIGIDIAEHMVEIAKKKVPKGRFIQADIESFVYPKRLDIIFAFDSLLHICVHALEKFFQNAHTNLNKDGIIYISMKTGPYHEETHVDCYGIRTFYFYEMEEVETLTAELFDIVYQEERSFDDEARFVMAFKKKEVC